MADTQRRNSGCSSRRQPSRLQRRAPASLQVSRSSEWNVAIPLLSPLVSPTSPNQIDNPMAENKSQEESRSQEPQRPPVFKKWQHPAAPFCNESVQGFAPFCRFS